MNSVNASGWEWCKEKFRKSLDPLPHKASLLADKGKVSSWVILCLKQEQFEIWDGLKDRDPTFLRDVWSILFPAQKEAQTSNAIYEWVEDPTDSRLRILTPESWSASRPHKSKDLHDILPIPSPEWCVTVTDERMVRYSKLARKR